MSKIDLRILINMKNEKLFDLNLKVIARLLNIISALFCKFLHFDTDFDKNWQWLINWKNRNLHSIEFDVISINFKARNWDLMSDNNCPIGSWGILFARILIWIGYARHSIIFEPQLDVKRHSSDMLKISNN